MHYGIVDQPRCYSLAVHGVTESSRQFFQVINQFVGVQYKNCPAVVKNMGLLINMLINET